MHQLCYFLKNADDILYTSDQNNKKISCEALALQTYVYQV